MEFNIKTCLGILLLTFIVVAVWNFGAILGASILIIASSIWYYITNENTRNAESIKNSDNTTNAENINVCETVRNDETLINSENPQNQETVNADGTVRNDETLINSENPQNQETVNADGTVRNDETLINSENPQNQETVNVSDNKMDAEIMSRSDHSRDIEAIYIAETTRLSPEGIESNEKLKNLKTGTDNETNLIDDHNQYYEEEGSDESEQNQNGVPLPPLNTKVKKQKLELLLIGKTGHGKSATANSIARAERFNTSSGGTSDTYDVQELRTEIEEFSIHVVDAPGVAETRLDTAEATEKACRDMSKAMARCPKGFHALLLVLKYGERFTTEEQDSICMLKNIFGDDIIRDYCIVIMTYGDCFDIHKRQNKFASFCDWLSLQEGPLKHLLNECKYRCVLFRNCTEDDKQKRDQVIDLLQMVKALKNREVRYTNSLFEDFKMNREKLIVKAKAPKLKQKIIKETDLMIDELSRLEITEEKLEAIDSDLENICGKVQHLCKIIEDADNKTGELHYLMEYLKKVELFMAEVKKTAEVKRNSMKSRIELEKEHQFEIEKMRRMEAEEKNKLSEKLRNATEDEKNKILKQMRLNEKAAKEREKRTKDEFGQHFKALKEESDKNLQANIESLKAVHTQQIQTIQKSLADMQAKRELELQNEIQQLKETIKEAQEKGSRRQRDPTKVELRCQDQQGKCTTALLNRHEPIGKLLRAYCDQYNKNESQLKFMRDAKVINSADTPDKLGLEDGDVIDVQTTQGGGRTG